MDDYSISFALYALASGYWNSALPAESLDASLRWHDIMASGDDTRLGQLFLSCQRRLASSWQCTE